MGINARKTIIKYHYSDYIYKFLELPVQEHFDHNTSLLQVPIVRIITYVRILNNECHKELLKLKSNFPISCNMLHALLTPV